MRPIDIEADNIDFCMASAQKGLMAMTGLSFVIGRRELVEASKDYPRRSYYCNLFRQYDCFECTGEMEFTPPVQTVYAAIQAMKDAGVTPKVQPIRGGTDGAQLSFKGLPCPNIFAGGLNFHGRYEYIPVKSMEKATDVIVEIARLVAQR